MSNTEYLYLNRKLRTFLLVTGCVLLWGGEVKAIAPEVCDVLYLEANSGAESVAKLTEDGRLQDAADQLRKAWTAIQTLHSHAAEWHKDLVEYKVRKIQDEANLLLEQLEPTVAQTTLLTGEESKIAEPDKLIAAALNARLEAKAAVANMDLMSAARQRRRCVEFIELMRASRNQTLVMFGAVLSKSLGDLSSAP